MLRQVRKRQSVQNSTIQMKKEKKKIKKSCLERSRGEEFTPAVPATFGQLPPRTLLSARVAVPGTRVLRCRTRLGDEGAFRTGEYRASAQLFSATKWHRSLQETKQHASLRSACCSLARGERGMQEQRPALYTPTHTHTRRNIKQKGGTVCHWKDRLPSPALAPSLLCRVTTPGTAR